MKSSSTLLYLVLLIRIAWLGVSTSFENSNILSSNSSGFGEYILLFVVFIYLINSNKCTFYVSHISSNEPQFKNEVNV